MTDRKKHYDIPDRHQILNRALIMKRELKRMNKRLADVLDPEVQEQIAQAIYKEEMHKGNKQ